MNPEVIRFLDKLRTAADIESAYGAVCNVEQTLSAESLSMYASGRGYVFTAADSNDWLATFVASIRDADLRHRWRMCRLRHNNDWAAFFALERELKIDLPEETYLGNPWLMDSDEENSQKCSERLSFFSRWIDYWKTKQ